MRKFLLALVLLLIAFTSVSLWLTQTKESVTPPPGGEKPVDEGQKPAIGGSFSLIDTEGKAVSDESFRGRVMLVYFGFTHCPDMCPVTIATMSKTMTLLGDKADQVAPIFISVDPERDTPPVMKDFLANFDKRFIGLTGTPEQIKQVAQEYKTYYAKAEASSGQPADGDYSVDHSGLVFMMGKDGTYIQTLRYDQTEQEMADAIKPYLK